MREVKCQSCGAIFEVKEEDISDGCCSDDCWDKRYAPGPSAEELTGCSMAD